MNHMSMSQKEITRALKDHEGWLDGGNGKRLDFSDGSLRGAVLYGEDMQEAILHRADLRDADLRWANLEKAVLRGADLCGANLRGANLHEAELYQADLRGADLNSSSGISFTPKSFGVKGDKGLAEQLAYLFCRIDFGDCKEAREAQNALITLANESNWAKEYGEIERRSA